MESTSIFNWISCVQDKATKSAPIIFEAVSACFIGSEHTGSVKFTMVGAANTDHQRGEFISLCAARCSV